MGLFNMGKVEVKEEEKEETKPEPSEYYLYTVKVFVLSEFPIIEADKPLFKSEFPIVSEEIEATDKVKMVKVGE